MWIAALFILAGVIYLAVCLVMGKIFVTMGTDMHRNTGLVDRETSPITFWIAWVGFAGALIVFTVFMIRTALA